MIPSDHPPRLRGKPPSAPPTTDHPRACGENVSGRVHETHDYGSPPRLRGKRTRPRTRCSTARITPAPAGKTPPTTSACRAPPCLC
jgi:hypothetical protein